MNSRWYLLPLSAAVIATSYTAFGRWGFVIAPFIIILATILNGMRSVFQTILFFVVMSLGVALLLQVVQTAHEAACRMICSNYLRQLGIALQNYKMATGSFPPVYLPDKDGKPMHSWRVLVLPYLEQDYIYKKYNFDEPWDSPNNRNLLSQKIPSNNPFKCPTQKADAPESTAINYVAVVGKNTAWQSDKSVSLKDLAPGEASKTILVIETADSGIRWTEPRDFCVDDISKKGTNSLTRIRGPHLRDNGYFYLPTPLGAHALLADGSIQFLFANMLTPDKLEKLSAVGGYDDTLERDDSLPEDLQINWYNCIMLALWVLSVIILLYWAIRTRNIKTTA